MSHAVGFINSLLSMHGVVRYGSNSSACWKYVLAFITKRLLTAFVGMPSETIARRPLKCYPAANTMFPRVM